MSHRSRSIHISSEAAPIQRYLLLAASITLFLLIVLGGMLRVTETGGACPDWPTCFGRFTPPAQDSAMLDYFHRALTLVSTGLLLAAAVVGRRLGQSRASKPLFIALALQLVQIVLGAGLSLGFIPRAQTGASPLHLGLSLLVLAFSLLAGVASQAQNGSQFAYRSKFSRRSLAVLGLLFILMVSGAVVSASGTGMGCTGWPLCDGQLIPTTPAGWINLIHRGIVLLSAFTIASLVIQAWRTQRSQTTIIVATTAGAVLFFAQALLGAKMVAGFPPYLLAIHEATAVAVWAAFVVQAAAVGIAARSSTEEEEEAAQLGARNSLWRDLLLLTKPIVVLLLLVTTYAGMVIGARELPSLPLAFWTLLGGFLAAGGSGAINQYIDRGDDLRMQRTQKRPIPAGRLTPGEGLAFGVGIALASFYILVAMVNLVAALLSLAGIIYYVLIYSIFLKKTTVQNIVIGGGAGAIPPLVGWAAATGSLNIPSLLLFAVIFIWTPPHFWALALVRRKDYARAGVPMLPVVRGETETRWQIFLYTLELVALSLLLPLFGLGSSLYLVGAGLLGIWLLLAAWKVWKNGGNKLAWKMYRYSSMYLAFLFVIMMLDALIM
jgi:protoheme IX farnesyltransferase